jgi:fatty-acyl-CoA synthase
MENPLKGNVQPKNHNSFHKTCLTKSYWPADTSRPLYDLTVAQLLRQVAAEVPNRIALVEGVPDSSRRRRWTYSQLLRDSEQVAQALLTRFSPGERVAVWAPNVVEWVLLEFGCAIAGIILVTVNPALQANELDYVLRQSNAAGLFLTEKYRSRNMLHTAYQVRKNLPSMREIIGFSDFGRFKSSGVSADNIPLVYPEDPCVIMYTSGTTGYPKGAILYNKGMTNSTRFMAERAGLEEGGVWINVMPMFHMGGCGFATLGTLEKRGTQVIVKEFDPTLYLELLESEKATFTLLVPTMIEALLSFSKRKQYNISTLKTILSGASNVEPSLIHRVKEELGCSFSVVFGQTEIHGGIAQTHLDDTPEDQSETVGQPYPQIEVKIADPETAEVLPLEKEGEICCRGYQTMIGYFNMSEETSSVLKEDGWLHTGDIGSMDQRGFLKVKGRLKDMIIRGGENIYPAEIETLLRKYPGVADVAVVSVPDKYWGEQVAAIIIPKTPENPPVPDELSEYCKANLAGFKRPRLWYFVREFPMTSSGKLQKFKLREEILNGKLKDTNLTQL